MSAIRLPVSGLFQLSHNVLDGSGYMMGTWNYFSTVPLEHESPQRRRSGTSLCGHGSRPLPLVSPDRCAFYKMLELRSWKEFSTVISGSPCEASVGHRSARNLVIVFSYLKTVQQTQTGSMVHPPRLWSKKLTIDPSRVHRDR